jgi:GPH family glycoside/pentoside/hexuronide:cation symporter
MTKLTVKEKLGYGSASLGDSLAYTASGTFLMFFLTTVAGISPAAAGLITAVGSVWNAVINPVIGHYANLVRTRFGKRRPLMFVFSLVLALAFFLVFTNVPLRASLKPFYYGFMLMLYWTGYTGFFVPYLALGADYTSDYDDRTSLRLFASLFNMVGAMVAMVLPTLFVSFLEDLGLKTDAAWSAAGLTLGILSAASILVTIMACKTKDPPCVPSGSEAHVSIRFRPVKILMEYISVFRLRPARHLVAASVLSLTGYSMVIAAMMYFFTYYLGLGSSGSSALLLARAILGALIIPLTGTVSHRIDKKWTLVLAYLMGIAILVVLRFTGVSGVFEMGLFTLGVMLLTSIYWQLIPSMYYDICEYDLLETGLERQATIVSLQGLVEAVAIGLGSLLLGLILGAAGFVDDAPAQSETAVAWIFNCATLIPAVFYIAAAAVLAKYPLDRKAYHKVIEELGKR